MSKFDDAMAAIEQIEGLLDPEGVEFETVEEMRDIPVAGGNHQKPTGRNILTIRIPYTLNRKFLARQIEAMMDYQHSCETNAKMAQHRIMELEEMMDEL